MKLKTMFIVFKEPVNIKKPFVLILVIDEPMIAACAGPSPGSREQSDPEKIDVNSAFLIVFCEVLICVSFCGGIFVFWKILRKRLLVPNRPDNKGSSGC